MDNIDNCYLMILGFGIFLSLSIAFIPNLVDKILYLFKSNPVSAWYVCIALLTSA